MVTAGMSDDVSLQVMEAGASGIFFKHDDPEHLIAAIEHVHAGEIWLDEKTLQGWGQLFPATRCVSLVFTGHWTHSW